MEMVPSMAPQAICLPSGLQATERANFLLRLLSDGLKPSGRGTSREVINFHSAVSQSFTEALLPPAAASVVPCVGKGFKISCVSVYECFQGCQPCHLTRIANDRKDDTRMKNLKKTQIDMNMNFRYGQCSFGLFIWSRARNDLSF